MSDSSLFTPLEPVPAPAPTGSARLLALLAWPSRVLETRREAALFAELSETEQLEAVVAGEHARAQMEMSESAGDRAQRARAIRAWYGAKAA